MSNRRFIKTWLGFACSCFAPSGAWHGIADVGAVLTLLHVLFFWLTFHSEASSFSPSFFFFFCSLVQRKQLCCCLSCCLSQTKISFLRQVQGVCFVLGAHLGQRVNNKSNLFPPQTSLLIFSCKGSPLKWHCSSTGLGGIHTMPQKTKLYFCQQH